MVVVVVVDVPEQVNTITTTSAIPYILYYDTYTRCTCLILLADLLVLSICNWKLVRKKYIQGKYDEAVGRHWDSNQSRDLACKRAKEREEKRTFFFKS